MTMIATLAKASLFPRGKNEASQKFSAETESDFQKLLDKNEREEN